MLVLTLLTVNILVILNLLTDKTINFVQDKVEVSVSFKADTSEEILKNAATYLRNLPQVKDVLIMKSEDVLAQFQARHENDPAILASINEVGGNPFGPSLIVKADSAAAFPFIIESLDNPQFREDIQEKDFSDYEPIIERIRAITERVQWGGYGMSGIFLLVAILIIFNTVRIGVFIHREEIGIMKLVGASNWFVRAPFLLESLLCSLLAVAVIVAMVFPLAGVIEPKLQVIFEGQSLGLVQYFRDFGWKIFGIEFLVLAFVGILSTWLAMRRYLKV